MPADDDTSATLDQATYANANADANVSVPADNTQGVDSLTTITNFIPAATQDLGSSNMTKEVKLPDISQPAVQDGSATFSMGSTAPFRYNHRLCMPCQVFSHQHLQYQTTFVTCHLPAPSKSMHSLV